MVLAAGVAAGAFVTGQVPAVAVQPPPSPPPATRTATANGDLAGNWTLAGDGSRLEWKAPAPLPVLDERIDVTADGHVVPGAAVSEDGRTVSVDATDLRIEDPSTLTVVAGSHRLDTGSRRSPSSPSPPSSAGKPSAALPSWDPGKRGGFRTYKGEYSLEGLEVDDFPVPVEMQAQVVLPLGTSGPRPVALFLHGRRISCYNVTDPQDTDAYLAWPCPKGWKAVPSHRGCAQAQDLLASQGWITLSISADGINAQDQVSDGGAIARSELVRAHLSRWAAWAASDGAWASAPPAVRAGPRPDLSRVLLIGHSRGGEGVNHAALDSSVDPSAPWRVRGQVLIAPTAFSRNPTPGVPTVVLLPACDGDVSDLEGQHYLDAARDVTTDPALRSAVYVEGANHNFFNTEWTPGLAQAPADDDWGGDPSTPAARCGSKALPRLTALQQRTVGAVYTAAAAQALVLGRSEPLSVLDGSPLRPVSTAPARIRTHALGGRRTSLVVPSGSTSLVSGSGTTAARCLTAGQAGDRNSCAPRGVLGNTPSFGPLTVLEGEPSRTAVTIRWRRNGGAAAVAVSSGAIPADATAVAARIAVPPGARGVRFEVRLTDDAGHRAVLGSRTLNGLPSTAGAGSCSGTHWAQEVRLPLDRSTLREAHLDTKRIKRLQSVSRSRTGDLWLLDAWSYRPGASTAAPVALPVLDVGTVTVDEGSSDRTVELPVSVRGTVRDTATVRVALTGREGKGPFRTVSVPPGTTRFVVPVRIRGNTLDSPDTVEYGVVGIGTGRIVASTLTGAVRVRDDDPSPPPIVRGKAGAVEGGSLKWTFARSAPSETDIWIVATFEPPADGTEELTVGDLTSAWIRDSGYVGRLDVPLSRSGIVVMSNDEPRSRTLTLSLPVRKDRIEEGVEGVRLHVPGEKEMPEYSDPVPGLPRGADLVGTVKDAA